MRIRDLGRTVFEIGTDTVALAQTRRKAASLLMFLVTRANQTATREQVLEELWPQLDPAGAVNSLNQTLYFLRRDIDPWYDDGISADYVVNEAELLWLDGELITSDSIQFQREASDVLSRGRAGALGDVLARSYVGRFAPEFEYEEWALGWRDRLHTTYLLLVTATVSAMAARGMWAEATGVLMRAHGIDPDDLDLESALVRALARSGARAAAGEQYSHFARAYRALLGTEPPTMRGIVDESPTT